MVGRPFPSGDPAADRRAGYAETLAGVGDLDAAIEVMRGALDLVPAWAAGWFRLGEILETAGERDAARDAFARATLADPADPLGAGIRHALLTPVPMLDSMPPAFVEMLFDQYAPRFERSLVGALAYRGPDLVMSALLSGAGGDGDRWGRALDLGCGTGLMGEALRPYCGWLEGIDISSGMLAEAEAKGLYDRLEKADIARLDLRAAPPHDLIVAADVFIYLGALERVIGWCAGMLSPGGCLAFTVETGSAPVDLRPTRRFAHSRDYVEGLLRDAGFGPVTLLPCVLRLDRGEPVAGLVVVASAPARGARPEGAGEAEALA